MTASVSHRRIIAAAIKWFAEHGNPRVTVSELAASAGVSRATIYNQGLHPDTLFQDICLRLRLEMAETVCNRLKDVSDPARRLWQGLSLYFQRAYQEPDWARFLCSFSYHRAMMAELNHGMYALGDELRYGIDQSRFLITEEDIPAMIGLISGATLSGMFLIIEGHQTWRDAALRFTPWLLNALGISAAEIRTIMTEPLVK